MSNWWEDSGDMAQRPRAPRCPNGHSAGVGSAYCPTCGAPISADLLEGPGRAVTSLPSIVGRSAAEPVDGDASSRSLRRSRRVMLILGAFVVLVVIGAAVFVAGRSEESKPKSLADWVHTYCSDSNLRKAIGSAQSARKAWANTSISQSRRPSEADYRVRVDAAVVLFTASEQLDRALISAIDRVGRLDVVDGDHVLGQLKAFYRTNADGWAGALVEVRRIQREMGSSVTHKDAAIRVEELEGEWNISEDVDDRTKEVLASERPFLATDPACDWSDLTR